MKTMIVALALVVLAVSPTFAAGSHAKPFREWRASAQAPSTTQTQWNAHDHSNAVFVDGTYAGSDPDPNIRAALAREFGKGGV